MSIFRKSKAPAAQQAVQPFRVWLLPDQGTFSGDDGEVTYDGFDPYLDSGCTIPLPVDTQCDLEPRVFHCRVAGTVGHHQGDVQRPCFELGGVVSLIPEPANAADPNALMVVGDEKYRAGYVPRDLASLLSPYVIAGRGGQGIVIKTFNKHGRRIGLRLIGSLHREIQIESVNQ